MGTTELLFIHSHILRINAEVGTGNMLVKKTIFVLKEHLATVSQMSCFQMSGQVSRSSVGEYQANERAGVAGLHLRVSGRSAGFFKLKISLPVFLSFLYLPTPLFLNFLLCRWVSPRNFLSESPSGRWNMW